MAAKQKMNPKSLENLKLGGISRRKGKAPPTSFTLMPETRAILKKSGNASRFIDLLVEAHQLGRLLTPQEILEGKLRDTTFN